MKRLNVFDRLRLGPKLLAGMVFVGLVPLVAVTALNYFQASAALRDASGAQLEALAATKAHQIEWWFEERERDIRALAQFPFVRETLEGRDAAVGSQWDSLFSGYRLEFAYHDLYLIAASGDILYTAAGKTDIGTDVSSGPYAGTLLADAFHAAASGRTFVTDLAQHADNPEHLAPIFAAPVYGESGAFLGVVAFQPAVAALDEIMQERSGLGETGETYLVGPDLLMRSDSRFTERRVVLEQVVDTAAARSGLEDDRGAGAIDDYRGVSVLSVWRPVHIGDVHWVLVAQQDLAEVDAPAIGLRNTAIAVTAVAAALIAVVAFLAARNIVRRVGRLRDALDAVAVGDVSTPIDTESGDEIGDMSRSYDRMRAYLTGLADAAGRVAGGDLSTEMEPQSERDVLGTAFATMVSNVSDAQGALRESEERFRDLYENANDVIYTTDLAGRITSANAAAEQVSGYTREELMQFTTLDLVVPAGRELARNSLAERQRGGTPAGPLTYAFTRKDGGTVWVEIRGRTLYDDEQRGAGVHVIARDITERVLAEQALRETEERFRSAFESAPMGIMICRPDGTILLANQMIVDMLGYTHAELLDSSCQSFLHPDDVAVTKAQRDRIIRGERVPPGVRVRFVRRDGQERGVAMYPSTLDSTDKSELMLVLDDVTERVAAVDALRESEERYRDLYENATDLICTSDMEGRITSVNAATEQFTGYSRSELLTLNFGDLMHPDDATAYRSRLARRSVGGSPATPTERRMMRKDGSTGWLEIRARTMLDGAGNPSGMHMMARDIDGRRRAERDRELAQRATVRSEFLSTMSHELRSPLTAVLGFAELLEQSTSDPLTERQSRFVRDIGGAGQHLLDLINDILDFSKIDAGRYELHPQPAEVAALVRAVARGLEFSAAQRGLDFGVSTDENVMQMVADERAVQQILTNLLSNAIRFTDEGHVALRARFEDERLVIEVEDTGIGIDPEQLERIFEAFAQLDSGLTRRHGGTGLGLAITRRLVEMHDGEIEVRSDVGRGTTFVVRLPLAGPTARPAQLVDAAGS